MEHADEILKGALDLHAHGHPEPSLRLPARVDNVEWASLAVQARMRGYVIKSHIWPTTAVAQMVRRIQPSLEVFGSITLNPPSGGLSAVAVEMAAQGGAKIVWMPTWSAQRSDGRPSIYLRRLAPWIETLDVERATGPDAIRAIDGTGALVPEAVRILDVCRRYDMTLATGHLPVESSIALARAARPLGVRVIFTHPSAGSVDASIEQQVQLADEGAIVEQAFIACMPMHHRLDPRALVSAIEAVGPERCIMTSDSIEAWNPPPPEVMRMFIASMLALGVSPEAVHYMTHEGPARAIGLPADQCPAALDSRERP